MTVDATDQARPESPQEIRNRWARFAIAETVFDRWQQDSGKDWTFRRVEREFGELEREATRGGQILQEFLGENNGLNLQVIVRVAHRRGILSHTISSYTMDLLRHLLVNSRSNKPIRVRIEEALSSGYTEDAEIVLKDWESIKAITGLQDDYTSKDTQDLALQTLNIFIVGDGMVPYESQYGVGKDGRWGLGVDWDENGEELPIVASSHSGSA